MYGAEDNTIFITRGDSAAFSVIIESDDGSVTGITDTDDVEFIMKNGNETLLKRKINSNTLYLMPSDTSGLPYGDYTYDLTLNGVAAIKNAKISVENEVTF